MNMTVLYIVAVTGTLGLAALIFLLDRDRNRLQKQLDAATAATTFHRNLWLSAIRRSWDFRARWNKADKALRAEQTALDAAQAGSKRLGGICRTAVETIYKMSVDLEVARERAALHCRMIDQQRIRGDRIWARLMEVGRLWVTAETALDDALDHRVTWSACPTCGRLVDATGFPSPCGTCRACGTIITESEIADVDPIKRENDLIDTAWNLYTTGRELVRHLAKVTHRGQSPTARGAIMERALDAAAKAHPDLMHPPGQAAPVATSDPASGVMTLEEVYAADEKAHGTDTEYRDENKIQNFNRAGDLHRN